MKAKFKKDRIVSLKGRIIWVGKKNYLAIKGKGADLAFTDKEVVGAKKRADSLKKRLKLKKVM